MNISNFILKHIGWTIKGKQNLYKRSVVAVAPHTSYLDGVIGYFAMKSLGVNFKVISAEWLFFWPFKYIMKYILHAFPVGMNSKNGIFEACKVFENDNKNINLIICPEGHLRKVDNWNKGFYLITRKSMVDLNIVTFNYKKKIIYIDKIEHASLLGYNDIINRMNIIYVKKANAKYPEKFSFCKRMI